MLIFVTHSPPRWGPDWRRLGPFWAVILIDGSNSYRKSYGARLDAQFAGAPGSPREPAASAALRPDAQRSPDTVGDFAGVIVAVPSLNLLL